MPKQSEAQRETVERVMHEYKQGELKIRGSGPKVKSRRQAIAIALNEAGATNQKSPAENRRNLRRTKGKERRGETAEAEAEGKAAQEHTLHGTARRSRSSGGSRASARGGESKSDLYAEARRRNVPGRSKMSKGELERALGH
ncbi:DUF6496 domain-containing protein [Ancylobacter mangrovi]|uniref:DUF6496 domain-containing protein n=1 Tax=Ancylobacter mangrovi TaxID=2972472 RepID=UPI0021629127|nr:DUF6496 domain-containing protein [Ancylobacter mangrovi]MCS0502903.1 DUF6496 domain-containing protein [Ancylobacter mangrovi]